MEKFIKNYQNTKNQKKYDSAANNKFKLQYCLIFKVKNHQLL